MTSGKFFFLPTRVMFHKEQKPNEGRTFAMEPLTFKQARVRDFIAQYVALNGYAPTFREIGDAMNLRSLASVAKYVQTLRRKGAVRINPAHSRSLEVIAQDGIKVNCPNCLHQFRLAYSKK